MNRTFFSLMLILALAIPVLAKEIKTETIELPTLQCGMCKKTIESKMKKVEGLKSIKVNLDSLRATVEYDAEEVTIEQIEKKIAAIGYDANDTKADRRAQMKLHECCQPGTHR